MVAFQALCLGVAASLVGLLAGYALALGLFHQSSGYLAEAFTLGTSTVVGTQPLIVGLAVTAVVLAGAALALRLPAVAAVVRALPIGPGLGPTPLPPTIAAPAGALPAGPVGVTELAQSGGQAPKGVGGSVTGATVWVPDYYGAYVLMNAFASVIRGSGVMNFPSLVVCIGVALLIPLSPLFIFGFGPLPGLGIAGVVKFCIHPII